MNYIETSFLRSNSIEALDSIPNKKISYKLFYELLSGINNTEEFSIRKKQIIKAKLIKTEVDWRSPIAILYGAFGILAPDRDAEIIKKIVDRINTDTQYEEINEDNLVKIVGIDLNTIKRHDDIMVEELKIATIIETKNSKANDYLLKKIFIKNEDNSDIYSAVELERENFVLNFSKDISQGLKNKIQVPYQTIYENYNGALDTFIRCSLLHNHNVTSQGKTLKKNDGHDFQHLYYINENDCVYSNDKIFKTFEDYGYIKIGNYS